MPTYDVTIIGSGPGGYVAAIRCAQLGLKVAIIEKYDTLGGTCLNVGCIPSKALLDSSEHYHKAQIEFKAHGIQIENLSVDFSQMIKRQKGVIKQTVQGIDFLMRKNKIDVLKGTASIQSKHQIRVTDSSGEKNLLETKYIVIATGSKPSSLPFIEIDKKQIITSTEALSLKKVPKHLIIIGGGVIGVELGSVYKRLGASVSIIDHADTLLSSMDKELGKELGRLFKKQGCNILTKHKVIAVQYDKTKTLKVVCQDKNDNEIILEGDYCLLAVGRHPYTKDLGLSQVGIQVDKKGYIIVNNSLQTSVDNIYAIGDVIGGQMLAHKAEEEGVFVAETIVGQQPHINYRLIPSVAYTWPEIASVGASENTLKKQGKSYKIGKFPFKASGRARASMDDDGFIKVLADEKTDEILGVHMIGPRTADLIMEAVTAMEYKASAEDIARICHPHPTYSEALKEACLAATENRPLHI